MVYDCCWTRVFKSKWLFLLDLSMVDRRIRKKYLNLKAPRFDVHWAPQGVKPRTGSARRTRSDSDLGSSRTRLHRPAHLHRPHAFAHTHTHTHTRARARTHTHTHTHTHTRNTHTHTLTHSLTHDESREPDGSLSLDPSRSSRGADGSSRGALRRL
jgi:hypothetical protein